jgi:hypothetical protein
LSDFFPTVDQLRACVREAAARPGQWRETNVAILREFLAKAAAAGIAPPSGHWEDILPRNERRCALEAEPPHRWKVEWREYVGSNPLSLYEDRKEDVPLEDLDELSQCSPEALHANLLRRLPA